MRSPLIAPCVIAIVISASGAAAAGRSGKVSYVSAGTVFLDQGTADGLGVGTHVDLVKRGKKRAGCDVTEASAHHAVCVSDRAERGDRFVYTVSAAPPPAPARAARAPLPSAAALTAARDAVRAAPLDRVPFRGTHQAVDPAWSIRGALTLRHQSWMTFNDARPDFQRTSLDASARAGIGLWRGLFVSTALRVSGDLFAPPDQRGRPGELVELYVWDAEVGIDDVGGPVVGALGRFRPRKAPGMPLLDGVQAGYVAFSGALELGAYAGTIPDLVTLVPAIDRITAGVYAGIDVEPVDALLVLPRARIGAVTQPDLAVVRAEAEGQVQLLYADVVSAGVSARTGIGGASSLPALDAVRADAEVRPWNWLRFDGGYRYLAPLAPELDFDLASAHVPIGGAHHASVGAAWDATSWVTLGATGGAGFDVETAFLRGYAGPEIGFPVLFGSLGGVSVGYLEELGTYAGRSAFVLGRVQPLDVVSFAARASYWEEAAPGDAVREGSLLLLADAPVLPWLSLRAMAQTNAAAPSLTPIARATPISLMLDLGVTGSL